MRFHVVSLPHTQTTKEYNHCAYTQKVINFCKMMSSLGHEVFLYSSDDNEALCVEHISVISKKEQNKLFGEYDHHKEFFKIEWDVNKSYWETMNRRAIKEISLRRNSKDFLCIIGGNCQKPIADAFPDMMCVEFGVGYEGICSRYRVFESYAWMHYLYGKINQDNGGFYDAVIPNYFDPEDFVFSNRKDDYLLYIGRLIPRKGVELVNQICNKVGKKLIVAGQGGELRGGKVYGEGFVLEGNFEYVGYVNVKERAKLMSKAKAVIYPTLYIEPFGGVVVEAMLCGTPAITTDFGAFAETVIPGVTGYRCHTFEQFVWAAKHVDKLNPKAIREYAIANYSIDRIKYMYEEYFSMLYDLWDKGWYQEKARTQLDWLKRY